MGNSSNQQKKSGGMRPQPPSMGNSSNQQKKSGGMQPQPPSIHTHFFSSLKQVEKRLKLDSTNTIIPSSQSQEHPTESLGSPIYLNSDQPHTVQQDLSEPPQEFLSNSSLNFPSTHPEVDPPQSNTAKHPKTARSLQNCESNDIQLLMQLLGLSDSENEDKKRRVVLDLDCDDGFYAKIVGANGPKCGKELERLDGWIKHFLNEKREPFRLAHLLLAKAAFHSSQDSGGFECLDIPSTIEDFLGIDPPPSSEEGYDFFEDHF